jgi:hypothetical protein
MSHPAERRRHARYDLIDHLRVERGRVDDVLELRNTSMAGALIELGRLEVPRWVEIVREVDVRIIHPVDLDAIEVPARVVRVESDSGRFAGIAASIDAGLARSIAAAEGRGSAEPPPLPR